MNKELKSKLLPFILTFVFLLLDQLTKSLIVHFIPPYTIGTQFFGDFLRIIHVSNSGVAFSMGADWSTNIRKIFFAVLPVIVIIMVIIIYFRNNEFSKLQRWSIAGILGGGIGNIIDRIFRTEGVVDFIDVKFYGLFGFERWPTFNIADSAIVICCILLLISFFLVKKDKKEK